MAGMAAAGAAAGTAIMPGIGTAIGGIAGAFMDGMGGGGGGSAGGAPQTAESAIYGDLGQDNSGWNVNFSGTQSNGSNKSAPSAMESLGIGGTATMSPLLIVGVVALLGFAVWKKSKSAK